MLHYFSPPRFLRTCVKAFIVIRNKSTLFINLFALMCSSGIPELRNLEDIRYLKNALSLDDSEEVRESLSRLVRSHWLGDVM